jgi:nucleotide-binding universal stress UspA family protein
MDKVLVVINDLDNETFLLDKALRFSPGSLCVILVNPVGKSESWLANKVSDYVSHKNSAQIEVDVKFFYEIEEQISASFLMHLASGYAIDLIILMKPEVLDNFKGLDLVKSLIRSPITAKLLMARRKKWPASPSIMCAVDIGSDDNTQMALDKLVFNYSVDTLQTVLSANLHLASVIGISRVSKELDLVEASSVLQRRGQEYKDKLNTFDHTQSVSASKVLVAAGTPSKEICNLAKRHNIDLVVMGNVGRKGLRGFVMGNTAEKILKKIATDVLVVSSNY